MPWETYDPESPASDDPQLTIYANLSGYINAPADHRWFADYDRVVVHTDTERDLIALEPADSGGHYDLGRKDGVGADVSFKPPLRDTLGFEESDVEQTIHLPLEWHEGRGAVADLSPLRDGSGGVERSGNVGGRTGDDIETGTRWCGTCGQESKSARGVAVHHGRRDDHSGDAVILDEEPDEADLIGTDDTNSESGVEGGDSEESDETVVDDEGGDAAVPDDAPSVETIRDCAEQVDTLSELAEELEKGVGETRLLAREADVLTEIDDDRRRMGAPSDD